MKVRILMLLMSVFAITPAILGSAWGVEQRSKNASIYSGGARECDLRTAAVKDQKRKQIEDKSNSKRPNAQTVL